jgi:hypothetical protein
MAYYLADGAFFYMLLHILLFSQFAYANMDIISTKLYPKWATFAQTIVQLLG